MRCHSKGLATLEVEIEMAATSDINGMNYETDKIELTVLYAYAT